jgi:hypothetical protein
MLPHLNQQSVHFVVRLRLQAALSQAHSRRLMSFRPWLFPQVTRRGRECLFTLQCPFYEGTNVVVLRVAGYYLVALQNPTSVGIYHEYWVIARV